MKWESLRGWGTGGSTVEISPSGQLHLEDDENTVTQAFKQIAVPPAYIMETRAKVDDYTTTAATSFGTKVIDGSYRLMLAIKSDGIYMIDSSDTLVNKKSIAMDNDWHIYKAVVNSGEVDIYMDDVFQFTSSMQTFAGSDLVEQWTKSASSNTAEVHVDYTIITNSIVNEPRDALTEWSTDGSTAEISPAGQLHLSDSSDTVTKASRSDVMVPTTYTMDTCAKIDDFTTAASPSFATKIHDGTYQLMLAVKSDGIYIVDSGGTLVQKKSIGMDTDWHTYRAVVDDGEAQVYMDGAYQFTSSMQAIAGSDTIEQWTQSADQETTEVHIDYTVVKYGNTPGSFSLSSPADGTGRTEISPQLSWDASAGAEGYQVVVADNAGFSDPVIQANNCPDTSLVTSGLRSNTSYYWKVTAKNAVGNTASSNNSFSFTTGVMDEQWDSLAEWSMAGSTAEIAPAGQLHLSDGSDTVTRAYRSDIDVPAVYTLETSARVDDFTETASASFAVQILDGSYQLMLAVKNDGIYMIDSSGSLVKKKSIAMDTDWHTYRVVVDDGEAEIYMDEEYQFSSSMHTLAGSDLIELSTQSANQDTATVHVEFTAIKYDNPPKHFALTSPADGDTEVNTTTVLAWEEPEGISRYRVVVADNSDFTDPICDADNSNVPTYVLSGLDRKTTYYWKVIAMNSVGEALAANSPLSFTTGVLDEQWDGLAGWSTAGSTVEISPAGQLHLRDSSDVTTKTYRSGLTIPGTYAIETHAKVDDFTTADSTSFGTKVVDGSYRLMLAVKSDGIYMIDSSNTLVKKKDIAMDTDWHTYKVLVEDGEAQVYMDDVLQFTSSMQSYTGSDLIEQWTESADNDTSEVHVEYTIAY